MERQDTPNHVLALRDFGRWALKGAAGAAALIAVTALAVYVGQALASEDESVPCDPPAVDVDERGVVIGSEDCPEQSRRGSHGGNYISPRAPHICDDCEGATPQPPHAPAEREPSPECDPPSVDLDTGGAVDGSEECWPEQLNSTAGPGQCGQGRVGPGGLEQ